MSNGSINLRSIYKSLIHIPNVRSIDGSPLYALTDEKVINDESKSLIRSDTWIKASKTTYNSPTNIRKIYITKRHVKLEFYKPIISDGKPSTEGLIRTRSVPKEVDETIYNRTKIYLNGAKDMGYIAPELNKLKISGNILSLISSPWVLSNIEEIYIDTVGLYSDAIKGLVGNYNLAMMEYNQNVAPLRKNIEQIVNLMFGASVSDKSLSEKFPRLRFIAIIPNLDKYLDMVTSSSKNYNLNDSLLYKLNTSGFEIQKVAVYMTKNANRAEDGKLATRTYYRFDYEYLKPFTDNWQRSIEEIKLKKIQQQAEIKQAQEKEDMQDVEKLLNSISNESGLSIARIVLLVSTSWFNKAEKQALLSTFTNDGKEKFGESLM